MSLRDKLKAKKKKMQEQMQRGRERTEQMKAEKLRKKQKKQNKLKDAKPGTVMAIRQGLATRSNPLDVMRAEYDRRKYEREQKAKKK